MWMMILHHSSTVRYSFMKYVCHEMLMLASSIRGPWEVSSWTCADLQRLVHCSRHLNDVTTESYVLIFLQFYKVPRGDELIPIVGDAYQSADFIVEIIEESHGFWKELISGEVDSNEISYNQASQPDVSASYVSRCEAGLRFDIPADSAPLPAVEKPEKYNHWYYLDEDFQLIGVWTRSCYNKVIWHRGMDLKPRVLNYTAQGYVIRLVMKTSILKL